MSLTQRYGKSSRSSGNGNCLEANYQTSSRSGVGSGNCLEANYATSSYANASDCGIVHVRDTKDRKRGTQPVVDSTQPTLAFSRDDWQTFIDEIKAGKYDFGLV